MQEPMMLAERSATQAEIDRYDAMRAAEQHIPYAVAAAMPALERALESGIIDDAAADTILALVQCGRDLPERYGR